MSDTEIKFTAHAFSNGDITLEEKWPHQDLRGQMARQIIRTRDKAVRQALIALGWTPPLDERGHDLASRMIPVEEQVPEMGTPVIGYNPAWVDMDFNERGLRECFTYGDEAAPGGEWHTAKWVDGLDTYVTTDDDKPTHWFPMMPGSYASSEQSEV